MLKKEMLRIYKPVSGLDWMNYRLVRKEVTYHHIVKREDGGKRTLENGALIMPIPHQYLHIIEYRNFKTYKHLNDMFKIINDQRYEPTERQRELIEEILSEFEEKHIKDRTTKGKILIKREYLQREWLN